MQTNTSRFSKRTKGVIAGAAGVALLLGGSTFALWSTTTSFGESGTIGMGEITVKTVGELELYDVSSDRTNTDAETQKMTGRDGHKIDTEDALVPGDHLAVVQDFQLELKGDNLLAEISLAVGNVMNETITTSGAVVTYSVQQSDGSEIVSDVPWGAEDASVTVEKYFATTANEDNGQNNVVTLADGKFRVILFVEISTNIHGTALMNLQQELTDMTVTVSQVRPTGKGNFA
ncbi:MAG: hypothetical protein LBD97_05040 [Bifidobacteriaceae bacterium]|jgi:alternate signal-mediated exported protein|nr:hypothetical protein [Bifidobacteriaceae bacterium]